MSIGASYFWTRFNLNLPFRFTIWIDFSLALGYALLRDVGKFDAASSRRPFKATILGLEMHAVAKSHQITEETIGIQGKVKEQRLALCLSGAQFPR